MNPGSIDSKAVRAHFEDRSARYDASSQWCTDEALGEILVRLTAPGSDEIVLDLACGTGLVSEVFRRHARAVFGVDPTPGMYALAENRIDQLVGGEGENLPFQDESFDLAVCRQGIQFMHDLAAVKEMHRVLRPGGRICLVHLCAYGEEDRDEYFEILRLRNPVRRNFYLREDLRRLMKDAGFRNLAVHDYITEEDVGRWSDHGAIPDERQESIREAYGRTSDAFRALHALRMDDGRIVDRMLFGIAIGVR